MDVIANPVEGPSPQTEIINDQRQLTHYLEVLFRRYLDDEHLQSDSLVLIVDDVEKFIGSFSDGIAKWKFVRRQVEQDNEISVFSISEIKGLEADMVLYIHGKEVNQ